MAVSGYSESAFDFEEVGFGLRKEDIDCDVVILEAMRPLLSQTCSILANNLHCCFLKSILCSRNIRPVDLRTFSDF